MPQHADNDMLWSWKAHKTGSLKTGSLKTNNGLWLNVEILVNRSNPLAELDCLQK